MTRTFLVLVLLLVATAGCKRRSTVPPPASMGKGARCAWAYGQIYYCIDAAAQRHECILGDGDVLVCAPVHTLPGPAEASTP